jgi:hypothetical protein
MRSLLLVSLVLVCSPAAARADTLHIAGETKYKPHALVRLRAEGVDAKAALLWRVHPSKGVERATTPRGVLEFAAHPGTYEVELLVIRAVGDGLQVDEARVTVEIEPCPPVPPTPPVPPKPDPKPPGGGKLDPVNALGRIRFGNAGCTATVIGPRRPDGRWDVLTAAHCVSGVGQRGTLTLKDGRTLGLRVVAHHRTPDVAWCVTEEEVADLPYALIAAKNPEPGTPIWHMGYGVDRPGNREDGTVVEGENGQGQLRMNLSVSSGDSGGGIFRSDTNELVSVVCCTSGMGRKASMWGCSAEVAQRTRPRATDDEEAWMPVPIPLRSWPAEFDDEWQPVPIPIRVAR